MLAELARWWRQQLLDLLPQGWRARPAEPRSALVIDCAGAGLPVVATCWRRRRRRERMLGPLALGTDLPVPPDLSSPPRTTRVLRLRSEPLECEVALPLAAESHLAGVLRAEFDRLTPFAAQDVFWTATVRQRDPARGRLTAVLSLIPRATLAPLLAALERHGLAPDVLETVRPDGVVRHIALHPAQRRRELLLPLLAGAAALALAAVMALPFVMQQRMAAELERQIAVLQPRVDRVQALRRHAAPHRLDASAALAEQRRLGDALQVLASLADVLPDDTFLSTFTLREGRLTITGQSAAAAALIATLSAATVIRNPAFAAPVVRDPAGRTDTFSLTAEVVP
jgi:general secretion pathway protein L